MSFEYEPSYPGHGGYGRRIGASADTTGKSMHTVAEEAVAAHERTPFWEQNDLRFAELRRDPLLGAETRGERESWSGTLGDYLDRAV